MSDDIDQKKARGREPKKKPGDPPTPEQPQEGTKEATEKSWDPSASDEN